MSDRMVSSPRAKGLEFRSFLVKSSSRRRGKQRATAALLALAAVLLVVAVQSVAHRLRVHVLRIALPDSEPGRRLRETLEKWNPAAIADSQLTHTEIEAVPLSYDDLFNADLNGGISPFDIIMFDDPWLAQLVEQNRLASAPAAEFREFLPRFAPEFLRVSMYRKEETDQRRKRTINKRVPPRRPTFSALVRSGETHPDLGKIEALRDEYDLYGLPYAANLQALVLHKNGHLDDGLASLLSSRERDWANLETTIKQSHARYYSRLGSNNSALADFVPLLWSEGGCLVGQDQNNTEVSGITGLSNGPAVQALERSRRLGENDAQRVRFKDEEVQTFLSEVPGSIGIIWIAYRGRIPPPAQTRGDIHWYSTPGQVAGSTVRPPCDRNEERSLDMSLTRVSALGTWLLGVDSRSNEKPRAWTFIRYLLAELWNAKPADLVLCGKTREIESTEGDPLSGYPTPFEDQLTCGVRSAVRSSRPRLSHPKWREIEQAVGFRIRQAHWQILTDQEAMACAQRDINNILDPKNHTSPIGATSHAGGAMVSGGCQ